jgi:cellulose biosynthesis protein BcsQ
MRVLAIVSHKGGAGKTSSSVMLAEEFARRGLRVVLVDADRQRGAGLLLGIEQQTNTVMQTQNPRLRYLCSSGLPLRELPARAAELDGLFDLAVVDTPSLDDPLARGWLQLCTEVLFVIPVEPISMRTLRGAESALEAVHRLNPNARELGTLPTLFDESDPDQRTLMMELVAQCPNGLLSPAIPYDGGLAHRAEQREDRKTEASAECKRAYEEIAGTLALELGFDQAAQAAPVARSGWSPKAATAQSQPVAEREHGEVSVPGLKPPVSIPLPSAKRPSWQMALAAVVVLALLAWGASNYLKKPVAAQPSAKTKSAQKSVKLATKKTKS